LAGVLAGIILKETQKGKMKNTKAQKSKRYENFKSKRCENEFPSLFKTQVFLL